MNVGTLRELARMRGRWLGLCLASIVLLIRPLQATTESSLPSSPGATKAPGAPAAGQAASRAPPSASSAAIRSAARVSTKARATPASRPGNGKKGAPRAAVPPRIRATIAVATTTPGAFVFLDGKLISRTPMQPRRVTLKTDDDIILLTHERFYSQECRASQLDKPKTLVPLNSRLSPSDCTGSGRQAWLSRLEEWAQSFSSPCIELIPFHDLETLRQCFDHGKDLVGAIAVDTAMIEHPIRGSEALIYRDRQGYTTYHRLQAEYDLTRVVDADPASFEVACRPARRGANGLLACFDACLRDAEALERLAGVTPCLQFKGTAQFIACGIGRRSWVPPRPSAEEEALKRHIGALLQRWGNIDPDHGLSLADRKCYAEVKPEIEKARKAWNLKSPAAGRADAEGRNTAGNGPHGTEGVGDGMHS